MGEDAAAEWEIGIRQSATRPMATATTPSGWPASDALTGAGFSFAGEPLHDAAKPNGTRIPAGPERVIGPHRRARLIKVEAFSGPQPR